MSRPDALEIMCLHMAASLVRAGRSPEDARNEAESRVDMLLEDLARTGAPVGVFLRRIKIYRLRCSGVEMTAIAGRFNLSRMQVYREYRAELLRRRGAA